MTLSDIAGLSEIFNYTKRRTASLRQLSFLFNNNLGRIFDLISYFWWRCIPRLPVGPSPGFSASASFTVFWNIVSVR